MNRSLFNFFLVGVPFVYGLSLASAAELKKGDEFRYDVKLGSVECKQTLRVVGVDRENNQAAIEDELVCARADGGSDVQKNTGHYDIRNMENPPREIFDDCVNKRGVFVERTVQGTTYTTCHVRLVDADGVQTDAYYAPDVPITGYVGLELRLVGGEVQSFDLVGSGASD